MIESVLRFSLHHRMLVKLLGLLLLVVGLINALELNIDAVPDITNRQVQINVSAPALSPEEVERRITFPLEVALAGLPRVVETRSISQFGLSQVTVVFQDEVDIYFARQQVNERLQEVRESLPAGSELEMAPVSTGLGEIYYVKLENDRLSLRERRSLLDWVVRPQLRSVPGLAEVNTWGGEVRQLQVQVDPRRLQARGLTLRDVVEALGQNNQNGGGSALRRGSEQELVRTLGMLTGPDDVRAIVLKSVDGTPVTVGQVATVAEGGQVRQGAITEDGQGEQVYAITMLLLGENGRVVVQNVKSRLTQIEKSLPEGSKLVGFMDRSELIDRTLATAVRNLVEGGLLVVGLLFLFLLQLRAGLIVSSAIPLSMLFAVIGMRLGHVSANLMSLGAIDFGLIVDGSVITVENCLKRLAERYQALGRPLTRKERIDTLVAASAEVLKATGFGQLIILATFVPILTLEGIEGKMFRPMAITMILALVGAALLSITLIPALCGTFLQARPEPPNRVLDWLTVRYARVLGEAGRLRTLTLGFASLFVVLCLALIPALGSEFLPELDEGSLAIQASYLPSISLDEVIERSGALERRLKTEFPDEVTRVVSRIGRPEIATDPMLVSQTDVLVDLAPMSRWKRFHSKAELVDAMAEAVESMPGVSTSFTQPIKMRMNELIEGVGIRADLGIKLFGNDPDELLRQARQIARVVGSVPGAADVQVETTQGLPQLQIRLDRARLARYGVSVADVNLVVEAALAGTPVTQINDGNQLVDVAVRLPAELRRDASQIGRLMVPTPSGAQVPLEELAELRTVQGPVQISREDGKRRIVVQANVRGRDLGSFVEEVQRRVDREVKLPTGYYLVYGGTYEKLQSGRARLALVVPITFGLVFLLLFITFNSLRQALLVFTGIPFALTGGVLALLLRGMPFSISAGIGFIALSGVAVLNGLVLVSFIKGLLEQGRPLDQAVREGSLSRLRPVLMTAAVASLGFLPMALSTGAGAEVQRPLATVVIGGLVTSTLLTLVVLPTLFAWWEER